MRSLLAWWSRTYEVPEVLAVPVTAGLPAYLAWVGAQVADPAGN